MAYCLLVRGPDPRGADPEMYVCASGHLHIKGTVQNLADTPLGQVKVAARAFDGVEAPALR